MSASSPTALELARRIRSGEESSEEQVKRTLRAVESKNKEVSAFVSVMQKRALLTARRYDRRKDRSNLPPFFGVPIGVKDLHPVRGTFTKMGSRSFRWFFTPIDDGMVRRLRRAGFVIVGKLSTSELGLLPLVEPAIHAPTRNPHNPDHLAGGSSGGSAAAVASGMLPIAPGSDGGGSVRIPASYCGLFGFKPSRGCVPNAHARIDPNGMICIGPIARSVTDAVALLDVLCGTWPRDPKSFTSQLSGCAPKQLRIQVSTEAPFDEVDAEHQRVTEKVVDDLRSLGHCVEHTSPPSVDESDFRTVYSRIFAKIPVAKESALETTTQWIRTIGRTHTEHEAAEAYARLTEAVDSWLGDADLLVTPTTAIPPPRVGQFGDLTPQARWDAVRPVAVFTAGFNISGNPAASVPSGFTSKGLPIGVQLVGRRGQDAMVLRVAKQLEALGAFELTAG